MTSTMKSQIVNLREFLEICLGKKCLDYSLRPLTAHGDNYGSIIQALTVTVTHTNDDDDNDDHHGDVRELNFVKL